MGSPSRHMAALAPPARRSLSAPAILPLSATTGHGATDGGLEAGQASTCTARQPRHAKPARENTSSPPPCRHDVTDVSMEAQQESAGSGRPRREEPAAAGAGGEGILGVRPAHEALRRARRTAVPKLCSGRTQAGSLETEQKRALPLRLHGRRLAGAFDLPRVTEILEASEAVWNAEAEADADGEQNAMEARTRSNGNNDEPALQREHSQCVLCGESSGSLRMSPGRDEGHVRCALCGAPRG